MHLPLGGKPCVLIHDACSHRRNQLVRKIRRLAGGTLWVLCNLPTYLMPRWWWGGWEGGVGWGPSNVWICAWTDLMLRSTCLPSWSYAATCSHIWCYAATCWRYADNGVRWGWVELGWRAKTVLQDLASYRHARKNSLGRNPQDAFSERDANFLFCREKNWSWWFVGLARIYTPSNSCLFWCHPSFQVWLVV